MFCPSLEFSFSNYTSIQYTYASNYKLLRDLDRLDDRTVQFKREDAFEIIRNHAMQKQHIRNEKLYNTRAREVSFKVGQEIFRRNFQRSNFAKGFSSKLAPNFIKAGIIKKLANCYYELEDLQGLHIGKYHAKDLKQ